MPPCLRRPARRTVRPVASGGGKVDISKVSPCAQERAQNWPWVTIRRGPDHGGLPPPAQVGLESIDDPVIQQNLKGRSRYMNKKGWVDPQGRKGKVRSPEKLCSTAASGLAQQQRGRTRC